MILLCLLGNNWVFRYFTCVFAYILLLGLGIGRVALLFLLFATLYRLEWRRVQNMRGMIFATMTLGMLVARAPSPN